MERFHIITLVVASASLILILTIAGILLTKDKHSQKFPTSHSDVPDGWEKTEVKPVDTVTGYELTHSNIGETGAEEYTNPTTHTGKSDPFTGAVWEDIDICVKKAWADKNNVYWDGITTYNGC